MGTIDECPTCVLLPSTMERKGEISIFKFQNKWSQINRKVEWNSFKFKIMCINFGLVFTLGDIDPIQCQNWFKKSNKIPNTQ